MASKKEMALAYAKKHWKIFPCAPNAKVPMAGVLHGVKDATDNEEQINAWWNTWPEANIGLACGSPSGIWVVDVDLRPERGIDGFDSIKKAGKTIQPTLSQETPSGGRHYLYKCDGEKPINKNGFLNGVDIRGDGYYIVLAPSSIGGNQYKWIDSSCIAEFPDDFKPAKREAQSVFKPTPNRAFTDGDFVRARAYVNEIPGAVEHVDGHSKLFWVAQVLINGFRLSEERALDIMWNDYNPRCSPPWQRNPATEREFRHKISEAKAKPNAEACAIYDSNNRYDDDFDFESCISDVRALIYPNVGNKNRPLTKQEMTIADVYEPEGLVGDIAKWINETAMCRQPDLALGASLTLCGAIMGRKVCDESNGRTNIYCMGIAPSSAGKDHPGDCINQILTAVGADNLMMGRMTSDTAIEKALASPPYTKIAVMDEVGHFFSNINRAGDNSSYLKTIKPTLMELFSSAHKTYVGKEKATGQAPHIIQPCMCIWGVTVPDKLYSGMTIEELQDGWIARNLIFIAPDAIPDIVIKPHAEVPETITSQVRSWIMRSSQNSIITAEPGGGNAPIVVPMDENAKRRFDDFNVRARSEMRIAHANGNKTQYLWGKALQNARRVALIIACGKEYESPIIGDYAAKTGCRIVEYLIRNAIVAIENNVSGSCWESDKMKILAVISSCGNKGCTKSLLTRRTQHIKDKRSRESYIEDLIEGKFVTVKTIKSPIPNGRSTVLYYDATLVKDDENKEVEHVDAE